MRSVSSLSASSSLQPSRTAAQDAWRRARAGTIDINKALKEGVTFNRVSERVSNRASGRASARRAKRRGSVSADKTAMKASNTIYDIVSLTKQEIFPTEHFGDLVELLESCIDDRKIVPILRSQRNAEIVESRLNCPAAPLEQAAGTRERTVRAARARAAGLQANTSGRRNSVNLWQKENKPIMLIATAVRFRRQPTGASTSSGTSSFSERTHTISTRRTSTRKISFAKSAPSVRNANGKEELPSIMPSLSFEELVRREEG